MHNTFVGDELRSQPACWRTAAALAPEVSAKLPARGERVAAVGCGSSWFMAMAYAAARQHAGQGEADAFSASEFPRGRHYDRVLAITRSGTTTEVVDLLRDLAAAGPLPTTPTTVITADPDTPAAAAAADAIALPFADEQSVVQTRFATSTLALLRASLGVDIDPIADDAEAALAVPVDDLLTAEQVTFIGRGWTIGLASEAALKCREAAQLWTEAYPAMDYRHGPIAIAQPGRLVWSLGEAPVGLPTQIAATGARFVQHQLDPMADLIVAQRFAVAAAERRGLDPDRPRALTRAVILD